MPTKHKRILAVASSGGHWIQLQRILPALEGHEIVFVTVNHSYKSEVGDNRFYVVRDATIWDRIGVVILGFQMLRILYRERPEIVISTGAACGYFGIRFGKWFGARTIWIDSIANVDHLSLSGEKVGRFADLWLTQWPHLAQSEGPYYQGSVL